MVQENTRPRNLSLEATVGAQSEIPQVDELGLPRENNALETISRSDAERILSLAQSLYERYQGRTDEARFAEIVAGKSTTMDYVYGVAQDMGWPKELIDNLSKIVLSNKERDRIMEKHGMKFSKTAIINYFGETIELLLPQQDYLCKVSETSLNIERKPKNVRQRMASGFRRFLEELGFVSSPETQNIGVGYIGYNDVYDYLSGSINDEFVLKVFDFVFDNLPKNLEEQIKEVKLKYNGKI